MFHGIRFVKLQCASFCWQLFTGSMLKAAPRQAIGVQDMAPFGALRGALLVCFAATAHAQDPAPSEACGALFAAAAQQAELTRPLAHSHSVCALRLQEVVSSAPGRTLVFARDVATANRAADVLAAAGLPVAAYHRGVPAAERDAALATLARYLKAISGCSSRV